jgi:hypothetical protein
LECGDTTRSSIGESEKIAARKSLKFPPFALGLILVLAVLNILTLLSLNVFAAEMSSFVLLAIAGMAMGAFGFLRPYPPGVSLSTFVLGILVLLYAVNDGDVLIVILLTSLLVAFHLCQNYLMYSSRVLQEAKDEEATSLTMRTAKGIIAKISFVTILAVLISLFLLNLSIFSSLGPTSIWTVLVLALLLVIFAGLIVSIPREESH